MSLLEKLESITDEITKGSVSPMIDLLKAGFPEEHIKDQLEKHKQSLRMYISTNSSEDVTSCIKVLNNLNKI